MTQQATPGPIALVGSGEYLEVMAPVEGALLAGRAPRYVQLATAAVPDGHDVVERWHRLGRAQADRLGVEAIIVPVNSREDADDERLAALIGEPGLIYLSGGDPTYLADTLRDTLVWRAIVSAWSNGSALAGCSAGAMAMAAKVPSWRDPTRTSTPGLGLLAHVQVIPHFDRIRERWGNLVEQSRLVADPDVALIGIDEDTAIVGGVSEWQVQGRQSAWQLGPELIEFRHGELMTTPPRAS
jgi:cyanophycinase